MYEPIGTPLVADHDLDPCGAAGRRRVELRRVRLRDDHDQLVRRERDRLLDEAVVVQELRVLRARRRVDVRRRALPDLERELVGAREAVARRRVDLREDLGQRRGREDGEVPAGAGRARKRRARRARRATRALSSLDHDRGRLDDRGRRVARLEGELLRGLARDHRDDPERARLDLDLGEQALDLAPRGRCRRAGFAQRARGGAAPRAAARPRFAATTRRLASSRRVRIRPWRSQRRSVSRLIPSRRAASPAVYACLGIA